MSTPMKIEYADAEHRGRCLRVTGITDPYGGEKVTLEIVINYTGDSSCEKAVLLDGQVIPAIIKAFNAEPQPSKTEKRR